jgi:sugar phosphate isomerase/epimerase
MPFLSLSTWSLHRNLGPLHWTKWDELNQTHVINVAPQPELTTLLELPAILAQKGFKAVEIGHFHIRDTSEAYLLQLKDAIAQAGIVFYTLLLDYGDISNSDSTRRTADIEWLKGWIDTASKAGAERVRIIGGQAEPSDEEALARSADALKLLCSYADSRGVKVVTENFQPLTSIAENCLALLEACGERLGLIADFGNFSEDNKFSQLAKIIRHSESIHAKAITDEQGIPDAEEFELCLNLVKAAKYAGPIVLIYDGPHDMWDGIERVKEIVIPYL